MRTADEIVEGYLPTKYYGDRLRNDVIKAINEARKEAIEECAKRLVINEGDCGEFGPYNPPFIEPESISALIEEIK